MNNKELLQTARRMIIEKGILNLKEFGYPDVNEDNILTDAIYSQFFKKMLLNNKGEDERIDNIIDDILLDIHNGIKL